MESRCSAPHKNLRIKDKAEIDKVSAFIFEL